MPLTADQQDLFDLAKEGLPSWWFQDETYSQEILQAYAVIIDDARQVIQTWQQMSFLLQATGIWLDQHARDRGTFRQLNESDVALRDRLRNFADAVNVASVLAAANRALANQPITPPTGYPAIVELRRDRAFSGTWSATPPTPPGSGYASRKMAYLTRGYRIGGTRGGGFIVILPYGTTAQTAASAAEEIRIKRAGGFPSFVERRVNP